MINFGDKSIKAIKIGNNDVKKIMLGSTQVWPVEKKVIPDGAILWKDFTADNLILTSPFTIGTNNGTGTYDSSNGAHGWFASDAVTLSYWDNTPHTAFATVNKVRYCMEIQILSGSPTYKPGAIQKIGSKLSNGFPYAMANGNPIEKTEVLSNGNVRISCVNSKYGSYYAPTRTGGSISICTITGKTNEVLSFKPISLYYYLL